MNYVELKTSVNELHLENKIDSFQGFEESLEFEHFTTFFQLSCAPHYTLLQMKDSEEFNTSKDTWALCLPRDGQMVVIDMGSEEEMCEQYFNLIELINRGFGVADVRKKQTDSEGNI